MIRPSRGDRKPCTLAGCDGTMQFGRRVGSFQQPSGHSDAVSGWTCDGGVGAKGGVTRGRDYLTLVPRHGHAVRDSTARPSVAPDALNRDGV